MQTIAFFFFLSPQTWKAHKNVVQSKFMVSFPFLKTKEEKNRLVCRILFFHFPLEDVFSVKHWRMFMFVWIIKAISFNFLYIWLAIQWHTVADHALRDLLFFNTGIHDGERPSHSSVLSTFLLPFSSGVQFKCWELYDMSCTLNSLLCMKIQALFIQNLRILQKPAFLL